MGLTRRLSSRTTSNIRHISFYIVPVSFLSIFFNIPLFIKSLQVSQVRRAKIEMKSQLSSTNLTSNSECSSLFLDILDGGLSLCEDKSLAQGGKHQLLSRMRSTDLEYGKVALCTPGDFAIMAL